MIAPLSGYCDYSILREFVMGVAIFSPVGLTNFYPLLGDYFIPVADNSNAVSQRGIFLLNSDVEDYQ